MAGEPMAARDEMGSCLPLTSARDYQNDPNIIGVVCDEAVHSSNVFQRTMKNVLW